jgi:hypothetical protein
MIRKVGRKYILKSKTSGRKLGEFTSKKAALKRERQINYFKNKKK